MAHPQQSRKALGIRGSLSSQRLKTLVPDAVAGLTGAVNSIPNSMAQATIAGVNPVHGFYASIFGPSVGGLFSSSGVMNISSTSALALLTGSGLVGLPAEQKVAGLITLTSLVGTLQLAAGLLRLGFLTYFVSNAVMTGFLQGVMLLILCGVIPKIAGFDSRFDNNVLKLLDLIAHPTQVQLPTLAVGAATIVSLLAFNKLKLAKVSAILALVLVTVVVYLMKPQGVALLGGSGDLGIALPTLAWPELRYLPRVVGPALAIAAIGLIQGAGVSQTAPTPRNVYPSISRDFVAQGAANLACGLFRGIPVGGSMSGTVLNVGAGAVTRLSNIFAGIFVFVIILLFSDLIALLPMPAINGILLVFVAQSLDFKRLRTVWHTNPGARSIMTFTLIATLALPLQTAVMISIGLSFLLFILSESHRVSVVQMDHDDQGHYVESACPKKLPSRAVTVLIPYGALFFAGARVFEDKLPNPDESRDAVVVLSIRGRKEVGSTFLGALSRYAKRLQERNGCLMLSGVSPEVRAQLERTGVLEVIGAAHVYTATKQVGEALGRAHDDGRVWIAQHA